MVNCLFFLLFLLLLMLLLVGGGDHHVSDEDEKKAILGLAVHMRLHPTANLEWNLFQVI